MKKFILAMGTLALMTTGFSSCNKAGNVNPGDKAFGDSIAVALGEFAGAQANSQYLRMKEMQPEQAEKFNKASFMRGVEAVLNADTTDMAYFQGLQMGMQLLNPVIGINNEAKVPLDKNVMLKAFKAVYDADSVANMNELYGNYQALMSELQARVKAREDSIKANSPEAKQALADGQAYAEKMLGEGYQKSESGLVYKIENPGAEPLVTESDMVKMQYVGKHINGEVFDTNEGNVNTMRASGFVPGFKEALTMLGKGGKMTAVIPADLAYGINGAGDKIGPNETLVFEIEIFDVNPKN